ncbi:MAG: hypothetical protein AB8F26_09720 [Phycisphaerales bacterium]
MTTEPAESAQLLDPPKRRRRGRKRKLLAVLVIALLAGVGLLQTPAAGLLVRPILAAQTGMEIETGSVRVSPTGHVIIRNAEFVAPGLPGPPGRVLRVDRIDARINWGATVRGSPGLKSLLLTGPELRLSQNIETGVLNAASFKLFSGGGGPTPTVKIDRGTIELGEHQGATFTPLRRWGIKGDVAEPDSAGLALFTFAAIPAEAAAGGSASGSLALEGSIGPGGVNAVLDGLQLEDWPASIVPTRVRALYARLDLRGQLLPTRFQIDGDGRVTVAMTLDGVDLNLPFDESYSIDGSGELLRMRSTRGTVSFGTGGLRCDISGLIDELVYDVTMDYRGLGSDAPFDARLATSFRMDSSFRPRRFIPNNVVRKLDMFIDPSGDLEAVLHVARPEFGAPITLRGEAKIINGQARYGDLPYPFTNVRGTVTFTRDDLVMKDIVGSGPTGAVLTASGEFIGLDDTSEVEIRIGVNKLPVDSVLLGSLSPGRRELVEALFSEDRYAELLADGLIRLPGSSNNAAAPEFAFGGQAGVDIVLRRYPKRPENNRWTTDVKVLIEHAGLVPDHFPLPIMASGIEITIADDEIELAGGRYDGLTGGRAFVKATLDQENARPGRDPLPIVQITANEIPIDERLLAAIPGYRDRAVDESSITLRSILDNLRVSGMVECEAFIGPRKDGSLGFDVEANLFGANAQPLQWSPESDESQVSGSLVLENLDGTIYVTERLIVVDLGGLLAAPGTPFLPSPIRLLTQLTPPERRGGLGDVERVGGLLPIQSGPPLPGPVLYADARAETLDLAMPIENAVAVVSPELAQRLHELRRERRPDGVVSLRAELDGVVGGHTETLLGIDRVDSFSFLHGQARHRIGPSFGRAELKLGIRPDVRFEAFRTPLFSDGESAGQLMLDGGMPLLRRGVIENKHVGEGLRARLISGRIESPATAQVIGGTAGTAASNWLKEQTVAGLFDLDVVLQASFETYSTGKEIPAIYGLPKLLVQGNLQPKSLALDLPDGRVSFQEISGRVTFEGADGRIEKISAIAPEVSINADGSWGYTAGSGADLDLLLSVTSDAYGDAVRTLLPEVVVDTLDLFSVQSIGPLEADGLVIRARRVGTPDSSLNAKGTVSVSGASAVIGLPITDLTGHIAFHADVNSSGSTYGIEVDADRLRAGSLRVEQAHAMIVSDPSQPGSILVPEITGRVHGGRVAGSAQSHASGDSRRFWVDMHGSDIRAAPVFDDLLLPAGGLEGPPLPGQEIVLSAWSVADDYTRGLLDTDLSLSGTVGDVSKTEGRGVVRIAGGSVVALPGLINLIEFSNLNAPFGATLDLADALFYIDGTTLAIERLSASSSRVEILGYGTLDWASREIDLRFRSRSVNPVPILSGLFESLRDELITTRISGTPGSLRYAADSFGGTKRLVRALLGESDTEQERVMDAVERASRAVNNRTTEKGSLPVMPSTSPAAWADEATNDTP